MHFSSPQTQYLNMTDLSIGIAVYLLYVLTDLARYSKCVTVSLYQYMFQFLQKHFSFLNYNCCTNKMWNVNSNNHYTFKVSV